MLSVECVPGAGFFECCVSLFCSFLWLWIVGGVGDVEACVMLSDAFLEDNVSDVFWVFFSVSHVTCEVI